METLAQAAVRKLKDFDAQGLANVMWSYAVLGFRSERLNKAILPAVLDKIDRREFGVQELANVAWAWDVTGDEQRLFPFLQAAVGRFIEVEGFTDAAACTDMANIVRLRNGGFQGGDQLEREYRNRFFWPMVKAFKDCADPEHGEDLAQAVEDLEATVKELGLTNFGHAYAREAFRSIGFQIADEERPPDWKEAARAMAREHLEEWRIPGTENIVVVFSYEVWHQGRSMAKEPTVVPSGWAESVHEEVKSLLRPVDARGWSCESYSERVAFMELMEASRDEFGDDCMPELTGWVRLYHSHHTSITGAAIFCQFRRQAPKVRIELDYDSGWYTWAGEPRKFTALSDKEESLFYYA